MLIVAGKPLDLTTEKTKSKLERWVLEKIKEVKEKKEIVFDRGITHDDEGALDASIG